MQNYLVDAVILVISWNNLYIWITFVYVCVWSQHSACIKIIKFSGKKILNFTTKSTRNRWVYKNEKYIRVNQWTYSMFGLQSPFKKVGLSSISSASPTKFCLSLTQKLPYMVVSFCLLFLLDRPAAGDNPDPFSKNQVASGQIVNTFTFNMPRRESYRMKLMRLRPKRHSSKHTLNTIKNIWCLIQCKAFYVVNQSEIDTLLKIFDS